MGLDGVGGEMLWAPKTRFGTPRAIGYPGRKKAPGNQEGRQGQMFVAGTKGIRACERERNLGKIDEMQRLVILIGM